MGPTASVRTILGFVEQEVVGAPVPVDKLVLSGTGVAVGVESLVVGPAAAVHRILVVAEILSCSTTP